jgi:hypothetical protein
VTLPELSIKRHVLAVMLNAVLVLFGLIAYQRMGMDKLPYIEFPVISVQTTQRGANPDVIDAAITTVIESVVNGVPGIEHIASTSSPGTSQINITFNLDKKIDVAFNEVQAKVNQILRRLPKDADPPVVAKVETNTSPIFWMAISGDRTQQQLNQYAINVIRKKLETIDGVGEVRIGGRRDRRCRQRRPAAQQRRQRQHDHGAECAQPQVGVAPADGLDEVLHDRWPYGAGEVVAAGANRHRNAAPAHEPQRRVGDQRREGGRAAKQADQQAVGNREQPDVAGQAGRTVAEAEPGGADQDRHRDAMAVGEPAHQDAAEAKADQHPRVRHRGVGARHAELGLHRRQHHRDHVHAAGADSHQRQRHCEAHDGVARIGLRRHWQTAAVPEKARRRYRTTAPRRGRGWKEMPAGGARALR